MKALVLGCIYGAQEGDMASDGALKHGISGGNTCH